MQVVGFGTESKAKTASVQPIFLNTDILIRNLKDLGRPQIAETGTTLVENATEKAMAVAMFRGGYAIAEDTGLSVDALDGLPGISPTCWTGKNAPAKYIEAELLKRMRDVSLSERRTATFYSVVAVVTPDRKEKIFTGELRGHIIKHPQGYHMITGFPYDRIFMPETEGKVLAELSFERRAHISHRGQAMQQAREYLLNVRRNFDN